ncbi:type II secretion system F family protein [Sulfurimonas sp.]|jgi:type II secretory pathway component PulF|uniref:type II secretion system F family protein n=1 Tax=Sulfurimonas sp. TaxID=2022749 RepID=UPI0025F18CCE|nr:type II secretion system F family protein [Sulfurimonas sp.]MBT5934267.1 type II secretion system F family protein [Sulfurimonas sp.]
MHFVVLNINKQGQKGISFLEATGYDNLLKMLERDMVLPLKILEIPAVISSAIPSTKTKVTPAEVIEMMENFQLVIKAGLPLRQGIVDLAEDSDNKKFKNMLFQIADDINRGKSLSVAFELYKDVVGVMILNLIKIGEETGQLELTLKRGASFLRRITALKKKAKSALIYPSFAFSAVMGAMFVWMIYVLPQMTELFEEMDVKLPPLTIFMMNLSDFLTNYIGYMIVGIVVLIAAFKVVHKKYRKVRWYTDKYLLKIPVMKNVILSFNTAFISEYIRLALVSGIPVFSALDTLNKNIENEIFKKALQDITNDIASGKQLSASFLKTKIFPSFVIRMLSIGESAGTLESQLDIVSAHYYEKVDFFAENIGKVIEPVVLIIVGGFMALVMVGLMGPMYDLISAV